MTDQKPIHAFAQAGKLRISTPITGLVTKLDFGDNSKEVNLEIAVSGEKLIVASGLCLYQPAASASIAARTRVSKVFPPSGFTIAKTPCFNK